MIFDRIPSKLSGDDGISCPNFLDIIVDQKRIKSGILSA